MTINEKINLNARASFFFKLLLCRAIKQSSIYSIKCFIRSIEPLWQYRHFEIHPLRCCNALGLTSLLLSWWWSIWFVDGQPGLTVVNLWHDTIHTFGRFREPLPRVWIPVEGHHEWKKSPLKLVEINLRVNMDGNRDAHILTRLFTFNLCKT